MKKNKLIELLNKIPGNPDIVFWNGFVADWQDFDSDLQIHELSRGLLDKVRYRNILDGECMRDHEPLLTDLQYEQWYKENKYSEWKLNHQYPDPCATIQKKKVIVLQVKARGKEDFDRLCSKKY